MSYLLRSQKLINSGYVASDFAFCFHPVFQFPISDKKGPVQLKQYSSDLINDFLKKQGILQEIYFQLQEAGKLNENGNQDKTNSLKIQMLNRKKYLMQIYAQMCLWILHTIYFNNDNYNTQITDLTLQLQEDEIDLTEIFNEGTHMFKEAYNMMLKYTDGLKDIFLKILDYEFPTLAVSNISK